MISSSTLPVMETFYTIQGEGQHVGVPAFFIRLAGCDVGCHWCDVKESWDADLHPKRTVEELVDQVQKSGAKVVVVTGGEPAMHDLTGLTDQLRKAGIRTHIETSGVYPLTGTWDWVTFSPKKFKAPDPSVYPLVNELKAVIFHSSDISWASGFVPLLPSNTALFLQTEWERREANTPVILDFIRANPGWRISIQVHKYIGVD